MHDLRTFTNLNRRSSLTEWMDDASIQDGRLTAALGDLELINRWLGGHSASISAVAEKMEAHRGSRPFAVLDIGCGGGDFAEALIRYTDRRFPGLELSIVGIDNSPATVLWAAQHLKRSLSDDLAARATFVVGDGFALREQAKSFDIVHCSLLLHHLSSDQGVRLMREMSRVARAGIIVNDLHRHQIAYGSILVLTKLLGASTMVQHDGPLSVLRAFSKSELLRMAGAAGLFSYTITWRWAFRWVLTTSESSHE